MNPWLGGGGGGQRVPCESERECRRCLSFEFLTISERYSCCTFQDNDDHDDDTEESGDDEDMEDDVEEAQDEDEDDSQEGEKQDKDDEGDDDEYETVSMKRNLKISEERA